ELFAAVTRRHVEIAQRPADALGHRMQHLVAGLMAETVVVGFEPVNINHQQRERVVITLRALQLLGEAFFEVAAVEQSGQRVGDGHQLEALRLFAQVDAVERGCGVRDDAPEPPQIAGAVTRAREVEYADPPLADLDREADERTRVIAATVPGANALGDPALVLSDFQFGDVAHEQWLAAFKDGPGNALAGAGAFGLQDLFAQPEAPSESQ